MIDPNHGTFAGQPDCCRLAYTGGSASHKRDLADESLLHPIPPVDQRLFATGNSKPARLTREILTGFGPPTEPPKPINWSASLTETSTDRPVDTSATETAVTKWLGEFEKALSVQDIDAAAGLFVDDCYWRDLVAFTWNIVTVEGVEGVRHMLGQTLERVQPIGFSVTDELGEAGGPTESWIKFETSVGQGIGHIRLRDGKAWTLLTTLNDLKGHEEPKRDRRPMGTEHGAVRNRQTWLEQRRREAEDLGRVTQPYVVIVGGGQGGIALGARLRQLGVPTIIVDRNP
ncbi:MAG TPA: nuclear transport factor 2 family protein, partial [Candidatus Eisenbacteria bacterium]|nr:nuclear transport factor 2 family protein [Candidatus Eisenbacteria bacterium]